MVRLEQNTFRSLMKIQGEDGGQLVLGLVDFNLSVRPSCQTDQPILPNYHLPELNLPDSGISKIKVNPTQVADPQLHLVLPSLLFRFRCDTRYIIGQHSLSFMCRRRRLQTCKLRTPDNMASKTAVSLILLGTSALLLDGGKLLNIRSVSMQRNQHERVTGYTGSYKINVPLFENSRLSAARQLGPPSQSANFGKFKLNSLNISGH